MDLINQLPFMQKFNKSMPTAAPASTPMSDALTRGVNTPKARMGMKLPARGFPAAPSIPGPAATHTVWNAPRGTRFGARGLAGGLNAAALGGQLLEEGLAGMDNDYGRKVASARDQREGSLDELAGMGIGGVFNSAFRAPSPEMGSLNKKRSVANMGGVSYDLSTPEGERGFSNARKAALKEQTKKGVMPGQLPSDYKQTEAAAFRGAAAAGDPQTESIRAMTGTDTSSGLRDAPPKELSEGMRIWAEAHPELAALAYAKGSKQSGYDTIEKTLGLSNNAISNYDADETFRPSDIAEADRQDPTKGRTGLKDMQTRTGQGLASYDAVETFKPSDIPEADRQNPLQGRSGLQDMQTGLQSGIQGMLPKESMNINNLPAGKSIEYDNASYSPEVNQAINSVMNTKVVTPDKIMAAPDPQAALQTFMKTRGLKR